MFTKATKEKCFLRAAFFGPSGAGKTYTALRVARGLGGKVAVIDSERRAARKYSDRFSFDVCDLDDRSTESYIATISAAAKAGYEVLIVDSLTHAWQDLVAEVEKLSEQKRFGGNYWSAWREGTPKQRAFVEAILGYPGHVICTMRASTEWQTGSTSDGKLKPIRIGLKPEQGKGIEYEFDLLLELDQDHNATVIKDRSGKFQDRTLNHPGEDFGEDLAAWLSDGAEPRWSATADHAAREIARELAEITGKLGKPVTANAWIELAVKTCGADQRQPVIDWLVDKQAKARAKLAESATATV